MIGSNQDNAVSLPLRARGAASAGRGWWGPLVGVLVAPRTTLAHLCLEPRWVPALAFSTIAVAATTLVGFASVDMSAVLEAQRSTLSHEQAEAMQRMRPFVLFGAVTAASLAPTLTALAIAGLFRMVFGLWGATPRFAQALAVTAYGMVPYALAGCLALATAVGRRNGPAHGEALIGKAAATVSSLSVAGRPLHASLFFSAWAVVLLGTGYALAAKKNRAGGIVVVALMWALYVTLTMALRAWIRG